VNLFAYRNLHTAISTLEDALQTLGVHVRQDPDNACREVAMDGIQWREVGEVAVHDSGRRIVAWYNADTTDFEKVAVLRQAELVVTGGATGGGWVDDTTPNGKPYRWTTICLAVGNAEESVASNVTALSWPAVEAVSPAAGALPAVAFTRDRGWHMASVPPAWAVEMLADLD
jgi:hypothetical protein